jgi:hypothetical protein
LSFTVSSARIDMFDTNGTNLPRFPECPAQTLVLEHCLGTMEGEVIYSVQAYDLDGTFFNTSGGAKVSGWEGNFVPTVWKDTFAKAPFWSNRNFTFDPNAAGPGDVSHARLSLKAPMHLRVDLSSVPVGGLFAVRADVIASALTGAASTVGSMTTKARASRVLAGPAADLRFEHQSDRRSRRARHPRDPTTGRPDRTDPVPDRDRSASRHVAVQRPDRGHR